MERLRNELTYYVCNFLINHVAVGQYRQYLRTVYGMGVQAFDDEFWARYEKERERNAGSHNNGESD